MRRLRIKDFRVEGQLPTLTVADAPLAPSGTLTLHFPDTTVAVELDGKRNTVEIAKVVAAKLREHGIRARRRGEVISWTVPEGATVVSLGTKKRRKHARAGR